MVGEGFDEPVGCLDAAAFFGNVIPNFIKVGVYPMDAAVPHLVSRPLLGGQSGATALHDVFGKLLHGFFGDGTGFATGKLSFGNIQLRKNLGA
jgi:hypothetical protein